MDEKQVMEFHHKNKLPIFIPLQKPKGVNKLLMQYMCWVTSWMSRKCLKIGGGKFRAPNQVFFRVHLIFEELAELIQGIITGNTLAIADALGDLIYVVLGFGVTYHIPVEEPFEEIHKANMTKDFKINDRRLYKGKNWIPPDINKAVGVGQLRQIENYKEL